MVYADAVYRILSKKPFRCAVKMKYHFFRRHVRRKKYLDRDKCQPQGGMQSRCYPVEKLVFRQAAVYAHAVYRSQITTLSDTASTAPVYPYAFCKVPTAVSSVILAGIIRLSSRIIAAISPSADGDTVTRSRKSSG